MTEWASSSRNSPWNVWFFWELRTQHLPGSGQGVSPEEVLVAEEIALLTWCLSLPASYVPSFSAHCTRCLAALVPALLLPIWALTFPYHLPLTSFMVSPASPLQTLPRIHSLPAMSHVLHVLTWVPQKQNVWRGFLGKWFWWENPLRKRSVNQERPEEESKARIGSQLETIFRVIPWAALEDELPHVIGSILRQGAWYLAPLCHSCTGGWRGEGIPPRGDGSNSSTILHRRGKLGDAYTSQWRIPRWDAAASTVYGFQKRRLLLL